MIKKFFLIVSMLCTVVSGMKASSSGVVQSSGASLSSINTTGYFTACGDQYADITVLGNVVLTDVSCTTLTVTGCVTLEKCKIAHLQVQGCVSMVTSVLADVTVNGSCNMNESAVDHVIVTGDLHIDSSAIKNIDYTGLKAYLSKSSVSDSILVHTQGTQAPSITLEDVLVLGSIAFDSSHLGLIQLMGPNAYVCPDRVINSQMCHVQWSGV